METLTESTFTIILFNTGRFLNEKKASHRADCFEFVDVNKIGRKCTITGFVTNFVRIYV